MVVGGKGLGGWRTFWAEAWRNHENVRARGATVVRYIVGVDRSRSVNGDFDCEMVMVMNRSSQKSMGDSLNKTSVNIALYISFIFRGMMLLRRSCLMGKSG